MLNISGRDTLKCYWITNETNGAGGIRIMISWLTATIPTELRKKQPIPVSDTNFIKAGSLKDS